MKIIQTAFIITLLSATQCTLLLSMDSETASSKKKAPSPTIFSAAKNGDNDTVRAIIERDADNLDLDSPDKNGRTPLMWACKNGHRPTVEILLQNHADPNTQSTDKFKITALHIATEGGHTDIAAALIKNHASIDALDAMGRTPLFYAAQEGHLPAVELLIRTHANPNAQSTDECKITALHLAAEGGHKDIAAALIKNHAAVDAFDARGRTPLMITAQKGHLPIVEILLQNHADPNIQSTDKCKTTALHIAAENGHTDIAAALIKNHAAIDALNARGRTPLYYAVQEGHLPIAELLLSHNANIKLFDHAQPGFAPTTALMMALFRGHIEVARKMVEKVAVADDDRCIICFQEKKDITPLQQSITACCFKFCCKDCAETWRRQIAGDKCPNCFRDGFRADFRIAPLPQPEEPTTTGTHELRTASDL